MASDPEHDMDDLLKRYAQKRRDEAGPDASMHPATRRLLQGEVARQYRSASQGEGGSSWFRSLALLWPRLGMALGLFLVLGLVLSQLDIWDRADGDQARVEEQTEGLPEPADIPKPALANDETLKEKPKDQFRLGEVGKDGFEKQNSFYKEPSSGKNGKRGKSVAGVDLEKGLKEELRDSKLGTEVRVEPDRDALRPPSALSPGQSVPPTELTSQLKRKLGVGTEPSNSVEPLKPGKLTTPMKSGNRARAQIEAPATTLKDVPPARRATLSQESISLAVATEQPTQPAATASAPAPADRFLKKTTHWSVQTPEAFTDPDPIQYQFYTSTQEDFLGGWSLAPDPKPEGPKAFAPSPATTSERKKNLDAFQKAFSGHTGQEGSVRLAAGVQSRASQSDAAQQDSETRMLARLELPESNTAWQKYRQEGTTVRRFSRLTRAKSATTRKALDRVGDVGDKSKLAESNLVAGRGSGNQPRVQANANEVLTRIENAEIPVLQQFEIRTINQGNRIQIVDGDGSVYQGGWVVPPLADDQLTANRPRSFRVAGTNLSLGLFVELSGTVSPRADVLIAGGVVNGLVGEDSADTRSRSVTAFDTDAAPARQNTRRLKVQPVENKTVTAPIRADTTVSQEEESVEKEKEKEKEMEKREMTWSWRLDGTAHIQGLPPWKVQALEQKPE